MTYETNAVIDESHRAKNKCFDIVIKSIANKYAVA